LTTVWCDINPEAASLTSNSASCRTMAATALPAGGIALYGAPDSDLGSKDVKQAPLQAMLLEMTPDMVDELLESEQTGKSPQLCLGRTPVGALQFPPSTVLLQLHAAGGV
jgi:RNA polymerase II elongation factor ELL